jgi:hypothetical protein
VCVPWNGRVCVAWSFEGVCVFCVQGGVFQHTKAAMRPDPPPSGLLKQFGVKGLGTLNPVVLPTVAFTNACEHVFQHTPGVQCPGSTPQGFRNWCVLAVRMHVACVLSQCLQPGSGSVLLEVVPAHSLLQAERTAWHKAVRLAVACVLPSIVVCGLRPCRTVELWCLLGHGTKLLYGLWAFRAYEPGNGVHCQGA